MHLHRFAGVLLVAFAVGGVSCVRAAAEPPAGVIAGWDSGNGRVLLGELGCTACHAPGAAANQLLARQAPRLGDVGGRVHPEYIRDFLTDPVKTKPGTPMPDVLHGLDPPPAKYRPARPFPGVAGGPMAARGAGRGARNPHNSAGRRHPRRRSHKRCCAPVPVNAASAGAGAVPLGLG